MSVFVEPSNHPFNSAPLDIRLLGEVRILQSGAPVAIFATQKEIALLIYLAYTGRPHTREALSDLFWDDRPYEQAIANLRTTISRLRRSLGLYLTITRKTIAFDASSPHTLDTATFQSRLAAIQPGAETGGLSPSAVIELDMVLQLYCGDFLDTFHIRGARGFDEWTAIEREGLRQKAITGLYQLLGYHAQHGHYDHSKAIAARLLAFDLLDEEAYRQMMRALALSGQRNAALVQYEACRLVLRAELGIEPEPATIALHEQIRGGDLHDSAPQRLTEHPSAELQLPQTALAQPARPITPALRHNLPLTTTPFFGRESELAQLCDKLAQPAYRLMTLVGPGGSGKTRLALAAALHTIPTYEHGVWFVALEHELAVPHAQASDAGWPEYEQQRSAARRPRPSAVSNPLATAIAASLGLELSGAGRLHAPLLSHLHNQQLLLILDSMEYMLDAASLIIELLQSAPDLTVLVTSREPLNFQAECVIQLDGLPIPTTGDPNAASYTSVQLFVERARRNQPSFALSAHNLLHVAQVCQLVSGLPLAIELAATWAKRLSAAEIAAAIAVDPEFLITSLRDMPERHRSMRAVFEDSWSLLSWAEQITLARVAVFADSFNQAAALEVAEATPADLAALVDKSLLRQIDHIYFALDKLLRQFALEKLNNLALSGAIPEQAISRYSSYLKGAAQPALQLNM